MVKKDLNINALGIFFNDTEGKPQKNFFFSVPDTKA